MSDLFLAFALGCALAIVAGLQFDMPVFAALALALGIGPLSYLALAFAYGCAIGVRDAFREVLL